ncbi:MAG: metal ABC transporter permease [Planctomycetota bacterium]
MDVTWIERLDLFRWAILSALVAGLVCPLVGALLLVRRTSFYGITLPQFATAGVVFGFVLIPWWTATIGLGDLSAETALSDSHAAKNYHLAWAAVFTFGGLAALAMTGRRAGNEIGRVAAAFAIANAATYLFGRMSPIGKSMVDELLAGEILGIQVHGFETLAVPLALILLAIVHFHRDLLLVSYDRESAIVLGKHVLGFEIILMAITGLAVATGTMILGPTLLFGLLVLPPLVARRWSASMASFLVLSSLSGLVAVVLGIAASFELDLPLGAAIVGVAALELLPGLLVRPRA